jgi:hypothetical protein
MDAADNGSRCVINCLPEPPGRNFIMLDTFQFIVECVLAGVALFQAGLFLTGFVCFLLCMSQAIRAPR